MESAQHLAEIFAQLEKYRTILGDIARLSSDQWAAKVALEALGEAK